MKLGRPIGLYDSGLGGLSVLREFQALLPEAPWVYVGDTARVPYGGRSDSQLIAFNREILQHLTRLDVQAVIVACNTSSAIALDVVAPEMAFPVLGMIEAGVRAALQHGTHIGVLATEATVRSQAHARAVARHSSDAVVHGLACPGWVPLIESGQWQEEMARQVVKSSLEPWKDRHLDAVILGCTHYPFLAPVIAEVLSPQTRLVDPAREVVQELLKHDLAWSPLLSSEDRLLVTGDPARFEELANQLLPALGVKAHHLAVQPEAALGV